MAEPMPTAIVVCRELHPLLKLAAFGGGSLLLAYLLWGEKDVAFMAPVPQAAITELAKK